MRVSRLALIAVAVVALPLPAAAGDAVQRSFPTQLFEPAIGVDNFFTVENASVAEHLGFGVGMVLNYQRKPLVVYTQEKEGSVVTGFDISRARAIDVVENQMTADLVGAIGLHYKWLHAQVGLDLPINLLLTGNDINDRGETTGSSVSGTGIGDLRMQLKAMLLRDLAGFSVAFSPIITFPTGKSDSFAGDPNVSFRPRLVAGYHWRDLSLAANVGYLFREATTLFSSELSHQLLFGAGAGYQVHPRVVLLAELAGRSGFGTASSCTNNPATGTRVCRDTSNTDLDAHPLEADVGARVNVTHSINVTAGAGFGVIQAIGSPQFRLLAGVQWAPDYRDADGDGIYDYSDKCPTEPEDKDAWQDSDGCPDPDNDGDLIPDALDKCPNDAEDKDGFQDADGCPEPDNDGDGIPDLKDNCPFEAETKNGFKDDDGCPDVPDKDEDGIPDDKDKCPTDPEDKDGFEDLDGCPDPDNDNDGIPDKFDSCPNEAEDMEGFKDDDGCPDPDNDGDGILDKQDRCPNEPETINGYRDDDGCPDKGQAQVIIQENKIVITKKVYFDTNKATIKRVSNSILDQVALTLKANPQIKGVRVEGHTDSQGNAAKNKDLSQRRAEAVRAYLTGKGIEPGRLFAIGYGQEKPIADNATGRGREENRRVEFIILEQAPGGAPGGAQKKEGKEAPVTDDERPQ